MRKQQQCGSVATPGVSSQCATFGPSLSRRSGMEPHAAEYLPAPPSPLPLVPHRHHFCIRDVWEWRRKAEGRPASQMGPRGSKA